MPRYRCCQYLLLPSLFSPFTVVRSLVRHNPLFHQLNLATSSTYFCRDPEGLQSSREIDGNYTKGRATISLSSGVRKERNVGREKRWSVGFRRESFRIPDNEMLIRNFLPRLQV